MTTEININPDILTWAINRAGFDLQDFTLKHPDVQKWIERLKNPTVKQLEKFSNTVHIPFGYLLLQEPPQESIPFPFFRTANTFTNKVSLNIYDTILILQRRQDWLTDYLIDNGAEPLPYISRYNIDTHYQTIVKDIRQTLGVNPEWAKEFKTFEDTLNHISKKIEDIGIIVNFNGVVENNTHRPIPVEECRGFVLVNEFVPFLFINAADAKAAQLFTIVHELAHIWLGKSAGFNNQNLLPSDDPVEKLCDKIAAEFLVPEDSFIRLWHENPNIERLAKYFKVSRIVIARRALDLNKITKTQFFELYNSFIEEFHKKKENQDSGGNFYMTARKRISVTFANYVNQAVRQDKLLYRDAYKITGLKGDTYQIFIKQHLQ